MDPTALHDLLVSLVGITATTAIIAVIANFITGVASAVKSGTFDGAFLSTWVVSKHGLLPLGVGLGLSILGAGDELLTASSGLALVTLTASAGVSTAQNTLEIFGVTTPSPTVDTDPEPVIDEGEEIGPVTPDTQVDDAYDVLPEDVEGEPVPDEVIADENGDELENGAPDKVS